MTDWQQARPRPPDQSPPAWPVEPVDPTADTLLHGPLLPRELLVPPHSVAPPGMVPTMAVRAVSTHLVPAALTTMLCCPFTGVVAMLHAFQAGDRWRTGDVGGAVRASSQARTWSIISLVIGLLFYLTIALLTFVVGLDRS